MKKFLFIITSTLLLLGCSAERQLAVLLARHPELSRTDTIRITTPVITKAENNTTQFTIEDLKELATDKVDPSGASYHTPTANPSISVSTDGSNAIITANPDGSFSLTTEKKTDTIFIEIEKEIPAYKTLPPEIKYVEVNKMNRLQQFFFYMGIIFSAFILIAIGLYIAKIFK